MKDIVKIINTDLTIKSIDGKRVVTFSDVDKVHKKRTETARFRFNDNKRHFIKDVDYFLLKPIDFQMCENRTSGIEVKDINNRGTTFLTESGYLMIVKSFSDDLAWKVQRDLVNCYFKLQEIAQDSTEVSIMRKDLSIAFVQINNMESMLEEQREDIKLTITELQNARNELKKVMDNMTLTTVQQNTIHIAAKDRVNILLGGAHSPEYKKKSRMYFINLWNNLKERFECGSRWQDLNPNSYMAAIQFIENWSCDAK